MSWTHHSVMSAVAELLREHVESPTGVAENTELVADLGIDSLGVMELVADIEDKFEMTIADAELRDVAPLGDVVQAIETRLRADGRLDA